MKNRALSQTKFITDSALMSYWKLDGNSTDIISARNGSDTGITYNASYGIFDQGALLNGSSSNILINAAALNFNTSQTWYCWFYPTTSASVQDVMSIRASGGGNNKAINLLSGGSIRTDFDGLTTGASCTASNTPVLNAWNCIIVIYDQLAGKHKIFLNGVKTEVACTGTMSVTSNYLAIGKNGEMNQYFFNGYIDDVAIFNRALSDSEAIELTQGITLGEYIPAKTEVELNATTLLSDANLLAYYRMEGNVNDSKGTNNGTPATVTFGNVNGKFGQGALLTTINSQISVPYVAALSITGDITISCWVKRTTNDSNDHYIICKNGSGYLIPYGIDFNSSVPRFRWWFGDGTTSRVAITNWCPPLNEWVHICCTRASKINKIYVNGNLINTTDLSAYTVSTNATANISIGNNDAASPASGLIGGLDDFAIFNRALSASEVKILANYSSMLMMHLNGNSIDQSGCGRHGTDTSVTYSQANGQFDKGASFNGSSGKILIPPIGTLSDFTISCWIKTTSTGATNYISELTNKPTNNSNFYISTNVGKITCGTWNGSASLSSTGNITVNTGNWVNIIITKTGTTYNYYVNGKFDVTATLHNVGDFTSVANSFIGSNGDNTVFFNGSIDEYFLETNVWSASRIAKYYSEAKGKFGIL